jgi:hypothetical protein
MNLDHYFSRTYNDKNYNCLHFAADIWFDLTGNNVIQAMHKIMNNGLTKTEMRLFEKLTCPQSPCIVLMQRPRCTPHVGIYIDGSVFHLTEVGPQYLQLEIATRHFKTLRYIK